MVKSVSSLSDVMNALPAAQGAVDAEIQARIAAGETIGSMDDAEMRERSRRLLTRTRKDRAPKTSAA